MAAPAKNKTSTALAPVQSASGYAIAQMPAEELREVIQENLGGSIKPTDLDRVRVPAGGLTTWTVPGLEGDEEVKEIRGVIIHTQNTRAFWKRGLDEGSGGTPPDCYSLDSIQGIGDPGIACAACPYAEFGSAKDGTGAGQACKQQKLVFVAREGDLLPIVIALPPTSLKSFQAYAQRLTSRRLLLSSVVTSFTLEAEKNANGIKFGKVVPAMVERLSPEQAAGVKAYATAIRPALTRAANPVELEERQEVQTVDTAGYSAQDDFDSLGTDQYTS